MIIDFYGNVKSRRSHLFYKFLNCLYQNGDIEFNINRKKGFLRFSTVRNSTDGKWQQYRVEPDGTITALTNGMLDFGDFQV